MTTTQYSKNIEEQIQAEVNRIVSKMKPLEKGRAPGNVTEEMLTIFHKNANIEQQSDDDSFEVDNNNTLTENTLLFGNYLPQ